MTTELTLEKEEPTKSADEFLDWYCWCVAMTGERFYPPDETAEECVEALGSEDDPEDSQYLEGVHYGSHGRAYDDAVEFFADMKVRGFDPVMRTQRYIEGARDDDLDLPDIDWEWLAESRYVNRSTPWEGE